jgi:hypothetical protein
MVDAPLGFKTCQHKQTLGECVQWPRSWEKQAAIAKYLGSAGIPLNFENGSKEKDDEKHYIPQLYLFTHRYDRVVVRIGDWIVLRGKRRFTVVAKDEFYDEYEVSG